MKKLFVIIAICFAASFSAHAQSSGWGIRGGFNFASFSTPGSDNRLGIHIGAFYNQAKSRQFAWQPEAAISLEGDDNTSFTNLNFGAMAKYYFTNEFNIEGGPQLGFIIGDDGSNADAFNFSLGLGATYYVQRRIGIGARYNIGLTDVFDSVASIENNVFQISGYFRL
ncbi:MAG: outer membrane beta-barrel protein [Bacteroidota bacterium]